MKQEALYLFKYMAFQPISVIVQEPTKYDRLLENAYRELESFRKKYEVLTELKSVFDAIDKIKKR